MEDEGSPLEPMRRADAFTCYSIGGSVIIALDL